jgi:hypothetical protein
MCLYGSRSFSKRQLFKTVLYLVNMCTPLKGFLKTILSCFAGHLAGADTGESGCYFNNAAVAVRAAQAAGATRVMVIDW